MSNYNDARIALIRLRMMESFLKNGDVEKAREVISRMHNSIINQMRRDADLLSKILAYEEVVRKES